MVNEYKVKISKSALSDIQKTTNWYENKQFGLGSRFKKILLNRLIPYQKALKFNP